MILDVIAAILIAYGFYIGYTRGIIKTVFAALSIIVGIVAALKLSPIVISFLQNNFNTNPAVLFIIGLIITFLVVLALIRFVGNRIENIFETVRLNFVNKLVGGAVMSVLFAVMLSYVFFFLSETNLIDRKTKNASISYTVLEPLPAISKGIAEKTKPIFKEFWDKMLDTMDKIKEKSGNDDEIEIDLDSIGNGSNNG